MISYQSPAKEDCRRSVCAQGRQVGRGSATRDARAAAGKRRRGAELRRGSSGPTRRAARLLGGVGSEHERPFRGVEAAGRGIGADTAPGEEERPLLAVGVGRAALNQDWARPCKGDATGDVRAWLQRRHISGSTHRFSRSARGCVARTDDGVDSGQGGHERCRGDGQARAGRAAELRVRGGVRIAGCEGEHGGPPDGQGPRRDDEGVCVGVVGAIREVDRGGGCTGEHARPPQRAREVARVAREVARAPRPGRRGHRRCAGGRGAHNEAHTSVATRRTTDTPSALEVCQTPQRRQRQPPDDAPKIVPSAPRARDPPLNVGRRADTSGAQGKHRRPSPAYLPPRREGQYRAGRTMTSVYMKSAPGLIAAAGLTMYETTASKWIA